MVEAGSGRIVNTASIAGQIGHPDIWYGGSKAIVWRAVESPEYINGTCVDINNGAFLR